MQRPPLGGRGLGPVRIRATFEQQTIAQREHINKLQADLRSLEEGAKRLSGGIKSREVYEAPGAAMLIEAHSALEDVVLTKDEGRLKRPLEQRWTELVYEGRWFSPAREAIDAFVDSTQQLVSGEVRLELRPNAAVVTGRRSPHMIYAAELASYGTGETFPHDAAEGFIRISSLETELHAARTRALELPTQ